MRWRQTFMTEVAEALQHLGLAACPVCGSTESLSMSRFPVLVIEAGFPPGEDGEAGGLPGEDGFPCGEDQRGDMTFAVRVECTACGHLMLFNAERYRTGDEKIMVQGLTEDEERQLGD